MFSAAFDQSTFAGLRYIGPVSAQAALVAGKQAVAMDGRLLVDGAFLIGPAGKVFAFSSDANALKWAEINKQRGETELALMAGLDAGRAAVYRARKRAALDIIAGRVVDAAGRCKDPLIASALIAESNFCFSKWAQV